MLHRREVERFARATGRNAGEAQALYLQHWVLFALSRRAGPDLVFKGGTALALLHGLPRFSQDLDFTAAGEIDAGRIAAGVAGDLRDAGLPTEASTPEGDVRGIEFRLRVAGPLFTGADVSRASVLVQVSLREDVLAPSDAVELIPPFPEPGGYAVRSMDLREIAAEKVRALLTRRQPRDVFDLHFLAEREVRPEEGWVTRKLSAVGATWELPGALRRLREAGQRWQEDLGPLTRRLPPFEVVRPVVEAYLGSIRI